MGMDGINGVQARISEIRQRFVDAGPSIGSASGSSVSGSGGSSSSFADMLASATSNGTDPTSALNMLTNADQTGGSDPTGIPGFTAAATALGANTGVGLGTGAGYGTGIGTGNGSASTRTESFVDAALRQNGDKYVWGSTAKVSDADPSAFDCSELTHWAAKQAGVDIPDGAAGQYSWLKQQNATMSVEDALKTRGALLFHFDGEPTAGRGEPPVAHVAISLGDGRTIEARGKNYGVGIFEANTQRFNFAGFVPGMK